MKRKQVTRKYREVQKQICLLLQNADGGANFISDSWEKELGKGVTMVLTNGNAIEKAAVNFSEVSGPVSENIRKSLKIEHGDSYFEIRGNEPVVINNLLNNQ